jgi:ABC-type cobalamin transport system ATPase subunit
MMKQNDRVIAVSLSVMPADSRSKNGVAEPVIGPATAGRTRWLAYVAGIHVFGASRA